MSNFNFVALNLIYVESRRLQKYEKRNLLLTPLQVFFIQLNFDLANI